MSSVEASRADYDCLNALEVGALICSPEDLVIRFANGRAESWFGAELEGQTLTSAFPGLDEGGLAEAFSDGKVFEFTGETKVKRGRRIAFRLSVSPKRIGDDRLLVVSIEDITKLRQQEHLLESFSRMIERKTRETEKERERAEKLLMNVFPYSVLQEFKEFGTTTPSFYDDVSVMFLDFVGFTRMPVSKQPKQLITELNEIFSTFDQIIEHHACERIKTIGDAYLAVSGMPTPNPDHAVDITTAAIKILRYLRRRNADHPIEWTCRIGIHTGSVVGSVVGIRKYIYDVFGDGVNTASRMQALARPMHVTVSEQTYRIIKSDFACVPQGQFEMKSGELIEVYEVAEGDSESDAEASAVSGPSAG